MGAEKTEQFDFSLCGKFFNDRHARVDAGACD